MKKVFISMLALFCYGVAFSQTNQIKGTVTDSTSGDPLTGVTIRVEGSSKGAVTDVNGSFSISISNFPVKLSLSYIGYKDKIVTVNENKPLSIQMELSSKEMNELVVVGYQKIKKKDVTGAVGSISGDDIAEVGSVNPMDAMQGKVAGVDISASSGRPGSDYNILIRGQNSLSGGNPLYVVDGVIVNGIDFLNPQDIERVDILKDASATAIYGSRGSNGVVIVTTKQAKNAQGATISYDGYVGIRKVARMPNFMNGTDWWEFRQNAYIADALNSGTPYDETVGGLKESKLLRERVRNKEYTNWRDYFLQTGIQQNHWLTVSQKTKDFSYIIGAGYEDQKGNLTNSWYKRYNVKASIQGNINEKWSAGMNFNLSLMKQELGSDKAVSNAFRMSPLVSPYDSTGELLFKPGKYAGISFTSSVNPLWEQKDSRNSTRQFYGIGSIFLQYSPNDWIDLKTTFAPQIQFNRNGRYYGSHTEDRQLQDPAASLVKSQSFSYTWDNQVTLHKKFDEHDFNFLGLYSVYYKRNEGSDIDVENLPYNSLFYNLGTASSYQNVGSNYSKITLLSFLARLNYVWKEKYLVTLSNRWDGSSKLAPGHKWQSFPSAALAWRASKEEFLQGSNTLTNLKLRTSYGFTGNNNIDPYTTLALSNLQTYYDFGGTLAKGFAPNGIVNRRLTWEKTREFDIGVDFGLWRGRVTGSIDYYNKTSTDLLMTRKLPIETGWGSMIDNIGSVRNKGVEVALNTVNIRTSSFRWSTSFTFAKNTNEILKLYGKKEDDIGNSWFIGEPINVNYTYVFDGIWQPDAEDEALSYGQSVGQAKVKDLNDDGKINGDDRRIIGSPMPSWTGGFSTMLTYKGFDLSMSLFTKQGIQINSGFYGEFTNVDDRGRAKLEMDYFMPENKVTPTRYSNKYPEPHNSGPYWDEVGYYKDASFVKIKNIRLGYNFSPDVLSNMKVKSLRVYLNVLNPFVFTDYGGFDPEWGGASFGKGGMSAVTYQLGVNLKF
ncbi:MAG TPA: TonB-dependent receptor [Chitinophagaceae bacterium]|nr:TonB-dependent receptor [Chitinophagaceae bacterium]